MLLPAAVQEPLAVHLAHVRHWPQHTTWRQAWAASMAGGWP
jgi:hypothetical protein